MLTARISLSSKYCERDDLHQHIYKKTHDLAAAGVVETLNERDNCRLAAAASADYRQCLAFVHFEADAVQDLSHLYTQFYSNDHLCSRARRVGEADVVEAYGAA